MKPRTRVTACLAAAALLAAPTIVRAQNAPLASDARAVDPVAVQALRAMGAYLKTLQTFELHSKATIETNMEDTDLQVTLGLDNVYRVQRPNRFFIEVHSDRQVRQYYYDGKNFTVNVPRQGFYAVVDAPPTIAGVVQDIYDDYGITLPLSDLFSWADDGAPVDGLRSAVRVGYARIGDTDTDQFAYRGDGLDFQVWIARGAKPLPMKIAITNRDDPTRPSYSAELTWNTAAKFAPATFAFKPDAKSSAIQMARVSPEGK